MKQLDYEDKDRYRKIAEMRNAAGAFAGRAGQALAEHGTLFHREAEDLGRLEANLDEARHERLHAWTAERNAARHRRETYEALRSTVCAARRFIGSLGSAGRDLVLRGPTPRDPEKLASWARILSDWLPGARIPDVARPLAAAFAKEIRLRLEALESALVIAESEKEALRLANHRLRSVRRQVDAEIGRSVRFLRATLERVGLEDLGRYVLGKRRGRPRKSVCARRKSLGALPSTVSGGRKRLAGEETTRSGAGTTSQEIKTAPSEVDTAVRKLDGVRRKGSTPLRKIEKGPCKPSEALPDSGQALSFQPDTAKRAQRRRRRAVAAVLGAPVRWFSSSVGRWISPDRRRGRTADRGDGRPPRR